MDTSWVEFISVAAIIFSTTYIAVLMMLLKQYKDDKEWETLFLKD